LCGRAIGSLIRIREIRGFALPGLVIYGEQNNLRYFPIEFRLRNPRTIEKSMQGNRINNIVRDSDVYVCFSEKRGIVIYLDLISVDLMVVIVVRCGCFVDLN
jgi:hypothetical protein